MGKEFKVNEFFSDPPFPRQIELAFVDTQQNQSDSVRGILNRFAREGVQSTPSQAKGSYAAQFSDDEPLDSPVVESLLEQDDLTQMDEMEIADYIRENTDIVDPSKLTNDEEDSPEDHASREPDTKNEITENQ